MQLGGGGGIGRCLIDTSRVNKQLKGYTFIISCVLCLHTGEVKYAVETGVSVNVYGSSGTRGTCWHDISVLSGPTAVKMMECFKFLLYFSCFIYEWTKLLNTDFSIWTWICAKKKRRKKISYKFLCLNQFLFYFYLKLRENSIHGKVQRSMNCVHWIQNIVTTKNGEI